MKRQRSRPKARPAAAFSPEDLVHGVLIAGAVLAFSTSLQTQFTLPKLAVVRLATLALAILWLWRWYRGDTRALPPVVAWSAIAIALWWGMTTVRAADVPTALAGAPGRFNGLWTSLTLLTAFAAIGTTPLTVHQAERRITVLLASLVAAACYTIAQRAGWDPHVWPFSRPASTIGHPVTLATALGMGVPFALIRAMTRGPGLRRWGWAAVFLLLATAMSLTLSRGPLLGLAVSLVAAVWLVWNPGAISLRATAAAGAALVVIVLIAAAFVIKSRSGTFVPSIEQLRREPEIQNRLHTLGAAAGMARDYPWLGVGIENYHVRYPTYRPVEAERLTPDSVPTMVHSGYLQALVTTGIPGLLLYLALLLSVLTTMVMACRRDRDERRRLVVAGCLSAVAGFAIADITGWPEVSISALMYGLMGLGISLAADPELTRQPQRQSTPARLVVGGIACAWIVVLAVLGIQSIRWIQGDAAMRSARVYAASGQWDAARGAIERGLAVNRGPAAQDDAGYLFAEAFGRTGDPELYSRAALALETAAALAPHNEYYRIHRIDLETAALQKRKGGTPAPAVDRTIAALLEPDRHNGTIYESIARLRLAQHAPAEALEMIQRARALRPHQFDYARIEGDIRRALDNRPAAIAAYREAAAGMPAGSPGWIDAERRLIVTLLENGNAPEARAEATRALSIAPADSLLQKLLEAASQAASATGS